MWAEAQSEIKGADWVCSSLSCGCFLYGGNPLENRGSSFFEGPSVLPGTQVLSVFL